MNVIGIIAEYNPFHNGHLYHLSAAKQKAEAPVVICAMSGNFVQRGEPALVNKWARAEMALRCGVDLVLELPVLYATRSAYWFARGGVETLSKTGVVSHLAFGVENSEPEKLLSAAELLAAETDLFKNNLKACLKQGLSYPRARARALMTEADRPMNSEIRQEDIWHKPNNILGLAYLQVLKEINAPLQPLLIERRGSGYHNQQTAPGELPSATAIRQSLLNPALDSADRPPDLTGLRGLQPFLPPATLEILEREFAAGRGPLGISSLAGPLMTLLRRSTAAEISHIVDIAEGLEKRIAKYALLADSPEEFLAMLKTKRYTYTRLQRFLIHLLLNYTAEKAAVLESGPAYLRILGFSDRGRRLLTQIKKSSELPLITKGAQSAALARSDKRVRLFWEMDVLATNLYTLLYRAPAKRRAGDDYLKSPVRADQDTFEV